MEAIIATEREAQELVAKCVYFMIIYYIATIFYYTKHTILEDVRSVSGQIAAMGLSAEEAGEQIIRRVGGELVTRYGREAGWRLFKQFTAAYDSVPDRHGAGDEVVRSMYYEWEPR